MSVRVLAGMLVDEPDGVGAVLGCSSVDGVSLVSRGHVASASGSGEFPFGIGLTGCTAWGDGCCVRVVCTGVLA